MDKRDASPAGLAADLLVAGHRVARLLEQELGQHPVTARLSAGEAMVLTRLSVEPMTMSGVMATLYIKASTATSLVNRLEQRGLVTRGRHPEDARSLLVSITEEGREVCRHARQALDRVDAALAEPGAKVVAAHRAFLASLQSATDLA